MGLSEQLEVNKLYHSINTLLNLLWDCNVRSATSQYIRVSNVDRYVERQWIRLSSKPRV